MTEKPNIVFIVCDALRPDHLSCYGYPKDTSPNIDKLARTGMLYENCNTTTQDTDPAFTSMFCGKHSDSHGIKNNAFQVKPEEEEAFYRSNTRMLAEILKKAGYRTIGIDWLGRWHKLGYDYYWGGDSLPGGKEKRVNKILKRLPVRLYDFIIQGAERFYTPDNDAKVFTDIALEKIGSESAEHSDKSSEDSGNRNHNYVDKDVCLSASEKPFFLMVHYWDTHTPFRSPKKHQKFYAGEKGVKIKELFAKLKTDKEKDHMRKVIKNPELTYMSELIAKYDASIHYVDEQIGRIVKACPKDTIFIITGDHGTLLGEHYPYFESTGAEHKEIYRIPLIIKHKEQGRVTELAYHIDIVPTLLKMVGITGHGFDGRAVAF